MSQDISTRLNEARNLLADLGKRVAELPLHNPELLEDPDLEQKFQAFTKAHEEATGRLSSPRLSIAMIGTTSSGKSTLVNALVGRRIAPIEAGEMSGGVLTLRHSKHRRLTVERVDGDHWEAGTWDPIADDEAYDRIRNKVMVTYNNTRRQRECPAPDVTSEGPLLPVECPSLLGLPEDLEVEFIDLPGVKSVLDRGNLRVIQSRVNKAFSLVALDYVHTDDDNRKNLLKELKDVVELLGGRTDLMVFILNRVDYRGEDDDPLESRIAQLREEIRSVLSLDHEPEILPFEARLLYRAQCAWGAASKEGGPATALPVQIQHIKALQKECAASLVRHRRLDHNAKEWLRKLEDLIEAGDPPGREDLLKMLELAQRWSGGDTLWRRLRSRLEESFAELVILPALTEVFSAYRTLIGAVQGVSKIRQDDSDDRLDGMLARIDRVEQDIIDGIEIVREKFRDRFNGAIEALRNQDEAGRLRAAKLLEKGFDPLVDAVRRVKKDLISTLIAPVRDALRENRAACDLEEGTLRKVIEPSLAHNLTRAYDRYSRQIPMMERGQGTLFKKVREDSPNAINDLEEIERHARSLFLRMRVSLEHRANRTLQGQAEAIRQALTNLLRDQSAEVSACLEALRDVPHMEAFAMACQAPENVHLADLPDELFKPPERIDQRTRTQREVVGKHQVEEKYATGTCFTSTKTRTVTRDVEADISYRELELPDEDGMAGQWSDGVAAGEESLWDHLGEWVRQALAESSEEYSRCVQSVIRSAKRALEQQRRVARDERDAVVKRYGILDSRLEDIRNVASLLQAEARSRR